MRKTIKQLIKEYEERAEFLTGWINNYDNIPAKNKMKFNRILHERLHYLAFILELKNILK